MTDLSDVALDALTLDEAARPKAPPVPEATERHRQIGGQLAAIHGGYLHQIARVAAVLERIEAGEVPPEHLRQIVLSLEMGENYRAFGSLCGQQCAILKMHHDIEQAAMFPDIEAVGGGVFVQIVAKLRAEHEVVHELLVRLERAAMTLVYEQTDENFAVAAETFRKLEAVLRSHFGYEETELAEAIGYYLGRV